MTSFSKPINSYLHNDPVDLNSPKSFGCLHHTFPPARDFWAAQLLVTHVSSPHSEVTAYQGGLTSVLWMDILLITVPLKSVLRCALISPVLTVLKKKRGGAGAFKSLLKLSAT